MLNNHSLHCLVNSFSGQNLPNYVVVATLFNELKATKRTAKQLSICSKNAQAITARAGDWGKSFAGITSFIEESAGTMIALADQIGDLAREMTRESVNILFARQLAEKLQAVFAVSLQKSADLKDLQSQTLQTATDFSRQHKENLRKLTRCLDEIKGCNRILNSVVAICRTEAARAGPLQESLWAVAENIKQAVEDLESQMTMGDKLMTLMSSSE